MNARGGKNRAAAAWMGLSLLVMGAAGPERSALERGVALYREKDFGGAAAVFDAVQHEPGRLQNHQGIPGKSYRIFRFIVKGNAGDTFTLRYESQKAKALETTIQLK